MYCRNCNKEIEADINVCPHCGEAVVNTDTIETRDTPEPLKETAPKKKGKKKAILISVSVLLLAGIIGSVSEMLISNTPESTSAAPSDIIADNGKNTIMIYMDGTDLTQFMEESIDDALESEIDTEKNNVLLYTGGSDEWDDFDIPNDKDAIYIIEDEELVMLEERKSHSMNDPQTLEYFMEYCIESYPAQQYSLILNDHGGGPNVGVCSGKNGCMSVSELSDALENVGFVDDCKLETVMFDACLMMSVEVAAALKDNANYMIGSENPSLGPGVDYTFLEEFNTAETGEDIGKEYVDKFYEKSCDLGVDWDITFSCIDLSEIDNVIEKTDEFFDVIGDDVEDYYPYFSRIREETKSVNDEGSNPVNSESFYYDLIDMYDFISNLRGEYEDEADALLDALDDAIVYNRAKSSRMNGLTFYSPFWRTPYPDYSDVCISDSYFDYISAFMKGRKRKSSYDREFCSLQPITKSAVTDAVDVSITLTEEQVDDFLYGEYYVFAKPKNLADGDSLAADEYMFVSNSFDVDLNGQMLEATVSKNGCYINSGGGDLLCPVYTEKSGAETANFTMISLTYVPEYGGSTEEEELESLVDAIENMELETGKMYLDISGSSVEPGTIHIMSDAYEYQRTAITIDDYDEISFNTFAKKTRFDSDSKMLPFNDWTSLSNKQLSHTHRTQDISMQMKPLDENADYFVMLVVHDIYGNVNCSGIVPLVTE